MTDDSSLTSESAWIPVWKRSRPAARVRRADELLPATPASPADAQRECNFVVMQPSWLPVDCRVERTTVRPERPPGRAGLAASDLSQTPHSENNPSSLRIEIAGAERRLRIKEFLYDWTPPTAGTATLWKSPWLTSADAGGAVCHFGIDYKGNRGACVQIERTQIELSVLGGTFDTRELLRIVTQLEEADPGAAVAVKETAFHELNYFVRYEVQGISSPYGLFMYDCPRRYDVARRVERHESVFEHAAERINAVISFGYEHDSSVQMVDQEAQHFEDETILRSAGNRSDHIWMACMGDESPSVLPEHPRVYANHPANACESVRICGCVVHLASVSRRFGGHEAMWRDGNRACAIWTSPSVDLDYVTFRDRVVPAIVSETPRS